MPGLRLTLTQASRLFGLEQHECHALLTNLVAEGFLVCNTEGLYALPGNNRQTPRPFWT